MEVKQTPAIPVFKSSEVPAVERVEIQIKPEKPVLKEELQPEKVTKEIVQNRVAEMNGILEPTTTALKFQFHEELNEYYVQVINPVTEEVLKEIPSKKFLDMYASMTEFIGLVVDEKK